MWRMPRARKRGKILDLMDDHSPFCERSATALWLYDDYGFRRFFLFGSRFSPPETGQKEEPCPGESVPVKQPFLCVGLHPHTRTGNHTGEGWPISVVQESTPGHAEGMGKAGNGRRLFTDDHGLAVLVNDGFSVTVYDQSAHTEMVICRSCFNVTV